MPSSILTRVKLHESTIQNLAIEMFKAINDLSTPDFSELFQLNEALYGLKLDSHLPKKIFYLLQ